MQERLSADWLELLEVGKFFHQLFHAVAREEHGELGIVAVAFAHNDLAFAVFAVAHTLAFLEARSAGWLGDVHLRTGRSRPNEGTGLDALSAKEARDIVNRALRRLRALTFWTRVVARKPCHFLALIFVVVMTAVEFA